MRRDITRRTADQPELGGQQLRHHVLLACAIALVAANLRPAFASVGRSA